MKVYCLSVVNNYENCVEREEYFLSKDAALLQFYSEFDKWNIEPFVSINETSDGEMNYFNVVHKSEYTKRIRTISVFPMTVDDTPIEIEMEIAKETKGKRLQEYYNYLLSKKNK